MSIETIQGMADTIADLERQCEAFKDYEKTKHNWENAFQKWCDSQWSDDSTSAGKCSYGSMCYWCKVAEEPSYVKPCTRALNKMCREKNIQIDYSDRDFEKIWYCEK